MTKDQILMDIKLLYQRAFEDGQWHIALRAKELQAKLMGIFTPQRLPDIVRIADMTEEQLREFVTRLEKNETELKDLSSTS